MTLEVEKTPAAADRTQQIERALGLFGHRLLAPPEPIAESVLNENFRVETTDGPRFLRVLRPSQTPERIFLEQRMLDWVAERGIPVVHPQRSLEGGLFVEAEDRLVQVYPWVEGRQGGASPGDAGAIGEMHARVHLALAGFVDSEFTPGTELKWDTERSIRALSRVDNLIRYYPAPPAESLRVQEALRFQLELLESDKPRSASEFDALPAQPCHGDYHARNILLGGNNAVAAVVDWEVARVIPPVFELLRALAFSRYLAPSLIEAYLRGYGAVRGFSAGECELGVEQWWQSRLHATWVYEMRFIRGDRRVERFFEDERELVRRFSDRSHRAWLVGELLRLVGL